MKFWTHQTSHALLLGLPHALVDLASGFVIFRHLSDLTDGTFVVGLVVLYNLLAFAGQTPAGLLADRFAAYRPMAAGGLALAAVALLIAPVAIVASIVVVGIGNAAFHVGAGAQVLERSGQRSAESGVFVGPGAIGLAAGIWLGASPIACTPFLIVTLGLGALLTWRVMRAANDGEEVLEGPPSIQTGVALLALLCVGCLLASVSVRAAVGGTIAAAWRGVDANVMWGLALMACLGKMSGGFVADHIGWLVSSLAALVASALLVTLLVGDAAAAIVGMLLFQMTMPVTLKAMHHVLPKRPGLAFGLPCLALVLGSLPGLLGLTYLFHPWPLALAMIGGSVVMVGIALVALGRLGGSLGPKTAGRV